MATLRNKKGWILVAALLAMTLVVIAGAGYAWNFLNLRHKAHVVRIGAELAWSARRGPGKAEAKVPILMYHSVSEAPIGIENLSVRPSAFEAQIRYLMENGFTPLTFDQLQEAGRYKKPIVITLDDGYVDNYTQAYPILKKYHCKATVFMVSNLIDREGYLSAEQIRAMSDCISIQSHTASHGKLAGLPEETVREECFQSKEAIEKVTGKPVCTLSYPCGSHTAQTASVAGEAYQYAVTVNRGWYHRQLNPYEIPRIEIERSFSLADFKLLIH
jgi:peptidoglycan/xylan/chitin deacetylase (PgdA/CDA1 family)